MAGPAGWSSARSGDEALTAYGQAYRLGLRNADLLLSLRHLHQVMGDADSALDDYERAAR